jgi:hypothetical protein
LLSAYENAKDGFGDLDDTDTRRFFGMQREFYVQLLTEWSLGRGGHFEHLNVEYYKGRLGIIMATPGERQYYVSNGRVILSLLETSGELVELGDIVYQELEGSPVASSS